MVLIYIKSEYVGVSSYLNYSNEVEDTAWYTSNSNVVVNGTVPCSSIEIAFETTKEENVLEDLNPFNTHHKLMIQPQCLRCFNQILQFFLSIKVHVFWKIIFCKINKLHSNVYQYTTGKHVLIAMFPWHFLTALFWSF